MHARLTSTQTDEAALIEAYATLKVPKRRRTDDETLFQRMIERDETLMDICLTGWQWGQSSSHKSPIRCRAA